MSYCSNFPCKKTFSYNPTPIMSSKVRVCAFLPTSSNAKQLEVEVWLRNTRAVPVSATFACGDLERTALSKNSHGRFHRVAHKRRRAFPTRSLGRRAADAHKAYFQGDGSLFLPSTDIDANITQEGSLSRGRFFTQRPRNTASRQGRAGRR